MNNEKMIILYVKKEVTDPVWNYIDTVYTDQACMERLEELAGYYNGVAWVEVNHDDLSSRRYEFHGKR